MNVIVDAITGSRLYKTHFEISDENRIQVYVESWIDLLDNSPGYQIKDKVATYELSTYVRALLAGDLAAHHLLWTSKLYYKQYNGVFQHLENAKHSFITKKIVEKWYNDAVFTFNKSLKLGEVKTDKRSIYDFLYIYSGSYNGMKGGDITISQCFELERFTATEARREIKINEYALGEIKGIKNLYELWWTFFHDRSNFTGIQEEGKLKVTDLTVTPLSERSFKGFVYYQKEEYEDWASMKKKCASIYNSRGYSINSMYHAMRMITNLLYYLQFRVLTPESTNIALLMDIRRSNLSREDAISKFNDFQERVQNLMSKVDIRDDIDLKVVKNLVVQIRNKISIKEPETTQINN